MAIAISHANEQASRALRRWPLLLLIGLLFALAQPFDLAFSTDVGIEAEQNVIARQEGSLARRIGLLGMLALSTVSLLTRSEHQLRLQGALGWAILLFLTWAALSVGWSAEPAITARKVVVLAILMFSALAIARLLSLDEILMLTIACCGAAIALGLASEIALGKFTPLTGDYRFAGVMFPAFSAWTVSLLFFAALGLRQRREDYQGALLILCVVAVVILVLAKTRASAAAFTVALLAYGLLVWPRRKLVSWLGVLALVTVTGLFVLELATGNSMALLGGAANLGRETESISNLTGRTDIWADLLPYIGKRPLHGYGYESFWSERQLESFAAMQGWAVPDSHNGFIELTLGVGVIGAALYAFILLVGIGKAWAGYRQSGHPTYALALAALLILVVNALFVATQLAPYLFSFVTLVLLARVAFVPVPCGQSEASQERSIAAAGFARRSPTPRPTR
jgi:O-antigen ligase